MKSESETKRVWVNFPKEWPQNIKTEDKINISVDKRPLYTPGDFYDVGGHTMTLSREGYLPFHFKVEVKEDSDTFTFPHQLSNAKWLKKFNTSQLYFILDDGSAVADAISLSSPDAYNERGQISNSFRYGDTIFVPENCLKDFNVSVTDPKYKRINETLDLTGALEAIILSPLKETKKKRDVHQAQYTIEESEEKGIPTEEGISDLEAELERKNKLIVVLAALAVVFFAAFIVFLILYLRQPSYPDHGIPTSLEQFTGYIKGV